MHDRFKISDCTFTGDTSGFAFEPESIEVRELEFGSITVGAHCWCESCGWELYPTGWYDEEGPVTLDELVSIWQDEHDGLFSMKKRKRWKRQCKATIAWREVH